MQDIEQSRRAFQAMVHSRSANELRELVATIKFEHASVASKADARTKICASLAWVAFAAPGALPSVYDHVTAAWLALKPEALSYAQIPIDSGIDSPEETVPIPDTFWPEFWSLITGPDEGYDAISITVKSAGLGQFVDPGFKVIAEDVAVSHYGTDNAASKPTPDRIDLEHLKAFLPGTLAGELLSLWTDNNFDPEVLDRDAMGLAHLSPALRYLNTRILQMHDVWHLVAGYETTGLHEIAISSFQLAQFGHNYSSMFLAGILKMTSEQNPEGFNLIMQTVAEAWQHGRDTPCMMGIEWEDHWHQSIAEIRSDYGIEPFQSIFAADSFEQLAG